MLTVLTIALSSVLRILAKYQNHFIKISLELSLQRYYVVFLFVQFFLIVILSFSFTEIAQNVFHDFDFVSLLVVQNLLKFYNYFFFYLILQGFFVSAAILLQAKVLFTWLVISSVLNRTSRKKWQRLKSLLEFRWETQFPFFTTLACIDKSAFACQPFTHLYGQVWHIR